LVAEIAERKKPVQHVNDLKELVVGYAKQETVAPLKSLGRYVQRAALAMILCGIGFVFGLLAILRGLQSIDALDGNGITSIVPYVVTILIGCVVAGGLGYLATKADDKSGAAQ
jgi:uncharacterized protein YacL